MPTRDQISADIRDALNDAGYFYSADDLNDSIQDGYDEIAAFTGCIEKAVAIDLVADQTYYDLRSLIPDFISLVAVYSRFQKRWLCPCSDRQLDKIRENWEFATGQPFAFWPVNYRWMAIHPRTPDSTQQLYIFYKAAAPTLGATTEPLIPVEICQDITSSYSTMDMFEQAEEWVKAGLYFKGYTEKIEELIRLMKKRDAERLIRLGGSIG